jgi:alkylhydroperoxidase family enzyme
MADRFAELVRRLEAAALDGPAETAAAVRRAVAARAGGRAGAEVPAGLAAYVDTIARHAYRVTPEDIAALRAAGFSEDAIFEVTVGAALGAGLARLEAGLAALRGGR